MRARALREAAAAAEQPEPATVSNHAERADILEGGLGVAAHIRDEYCAHSGEALWSQEVNPGGTTNEGTKYAVFPKANTGYARTLIKAVPKDEYSRDSRLGPDGNGWYAGVVDGEALYVREGTAEQCGPSGAATAAVCAWTRM